MTSGITRISLRIVCIKSVHEARTDHADIFIFQQVIYLFKFDGFDIAHTDRSCSMFLFILNPYDKYNRDYLFIDTSTTLSQHLLTNS